MNPMKARLLQLRAAKAKELAEQQATLEAMEQQLHIDRANAAIADALDRAPRGKTGWLSDVAKPHAAMPDPEPEQFSDEVVPAEPVITGGQVKKGDVTFAMFNAKQREAVERASNGESFCLIGSAGTGKTTTQRVLVQELVKTGRIGKIRNCLGGNTYYNGAPAVGIFSYTNKAVNNIRDSLPQEFKPFCTTFHSVLEYHPVFEEVTVGDETKNTRRFIPKFGVEPTTKLGEGMKLPHLDVVIVEEAGSVPTELWATFLSALPSTENTVFIKLGDLNQLPPVFGDAVLGFALLDLTIVELVEVYRAALESPITRLAIAVKDGKTMSDAEVKAFEEYNKPDSILSVTAFKPSARGMASDLMARSFGQYCHDWTMAGVFDPETSVILIPFNKSFGTIELNKWIGEALRVKKELVTYHVIAGFESHYFCVGDRVLYGKAECEIIGFAPNTGYSSGTQPLMPSKNLDRWGRNTGNEMLNQASMSIEQMLELAALQVGDGNTARQASHIITLRDINTGNELEAKSAGEVNSMLFTWCLSIHKSQGSEWPHVILVLHDSHKKMWKRELIYTGITRARNRLDIYYSGEKGHTRCSAFQIGVSRSEYGAVTLEGKLNYFRAKRRKAEILAKAGRPDASVLAGLVRPLEDE